MKKYIFDVTDGILRASNGQAATANEGQQPAFTLGQKDILNIQLVTDSDLTKYSLLTGTTTAAFYSDADYENPGIPVSVGSSNWTNSSGSEYYHSLTGGEPDVVEFNNIEVTQGTAGSLAAGEWDYDSLNSRLYVRLSDSSDPGTQDDEYITVTYTNSDATDLAIESGGDVFNLADSWYDEDTELYRNPVITDGELTFSINANTVPFYNKLGSLDRVTGFSEVQFFVPSGGDVDFWFKIKFDKTYFNNRLLSSGSNPLELAGVDVYTKAETLALLGLKQNIDYSAFDTKATVVDADTFAGNDSDDSGNLIVVTALKIYTYIKAKLDLVYATLVDTPTNGHILTTDADGQPTDSGKAFNDSGETTSDVWTASKVISYISTSIGAAVILQGSWDADTNDPDISGTTTTGLAWRVTVAGTTDLGGITSWAVGDMAIKTATGWIKIDNEDIAAIWGNISGTLSDQTDLQSALDGKQASSDNLTSVAGLTYAEAAFIKMTGANAFALRTIAQVKEDLGIDNVSNIKVKVDATTAPTATDDSSDGYGVLSMWADVTNQKIYFCINPEVDNAQWIELGTGSGGGLTWQTITAATNAVADNGYIMDVNASAFSLTFPAAPTDGDAIGFKVVRSTTYAATLAGNGKNLEGSANVTPNNNDGGILVYSSAVGEWVLVTELASEAGGGGTGTGDVIGPATNTDNYVPQWDGADSKTLKNGLAVGTAANNLVQLDGDAKLPAVDGSQLTNLPSGGGSWGYTWNAVDFPQDWEEATWTNVGSNRPPIDYDTLNAPCWSVDYNTAEGMGIFQSPVFTSTPTNLIIKIVAQCETPGATGDNMGWKMDFTRYRDGTAESTIETVTLGTTAFETTGITTGTYTIAISGLTAGIASGDVIAAIVYPNTSASSRKECDWLVTQISMGVS